MALTEDSLRPDGYWKALSEAGWARVRACPAPVREAAKANVMKTYAINRSYMGLLDPAEVAEMVVNQLLYDGWTLAPPQKESDEHADDERAGRKDGSSASG